MNQQTSRRHIETAGDLLLIAFCLAIAIAIL